MTSTRKLESNKSNAAPVRGLREENCVHGTTLAGMGWPHLLKMIVRREGGSNP